MSKGSRPRPYSINLSQFSDNFEKIFGKKNTPDCLCSRSPTGKCIGWHSLSEQEYQKVLEEYFERNK